MADKKVRFNTDINEVIIIDKVYGQEYNKCRKGDVWMFARLDRLRFKMRCNQLETLISKVFNNRVKGYFKYNHVRNIKWKFIKSE